MLQQVVSHDGTFPFLRVHALHRSALDSSLRGLTQWEVAVALRHGVAVGTDSPTDGHAAMCDTCVSLDGACLLVKQTGSQKVVACLPLGSAQVSWTWDRATGEVVLLVNTGDIDECCVWLFIVHDGSLEPMDCQMSACRALDALCECGAVRTSFACSLVITGDKPLGHGSAGEVWRAEAHHDEDEDEKAQASEEGQDERECRTGVACQAGICEVAAKVFLDASHADEECHGVPYALKREVGLLTDVQGHPNIIRLHSLFLLGADSVPTSRSDDVASVPRWCFTMEFCSRGDLHSAVSCSPFQENAARDIMKCILGALAYIHARGILHRDVKAENVLLRANGVPVLADFGISCRASDVQARMCRCGSPGSVAPEVLLGHGWHEKSDLFSAGVMLYYMLSGKGPFQRREVSETLNCTVNSRLSFSAHRCFRGASPEVKSFLRLLLGKSPDNRPLAEEALQETWFMGYAPPTVDIAERDTKSEIPFSQVAQVPQTTSCDTTDGDREPLVSGSQSWKPWNKSRLGRLAQSLRPQFATRPLPVFSPVRIRSAFRSGAKVSSVVPVSEADHLDHERLTSHTSTTSVPSISPSMSSRPSQTSQMSRSPNFCIPQENFDLDLMFEMGDHSKGMKIEMHRHSCVDIAWK
mmetsp:Transcript_63544/g.160330  ORF Transcript_63544/g.160330 Transcript_63544/m.160330 type:complete len:640 (-) Transcript_63544:381-2300(-)